MSTITPEMGKRSLEVRRARARLLQEMHSLPVRESRAMAADLLDVLPPELVSVNATRFLSAVRAPATSGMPKAKRVQRWLDEVGASGRRSVGELTPRQARALADVLR